MDIRDYSNRIQHETKQVLHHHVAPALPYWIAGGLTGLLATGYAVLFRFLGSRAELIFAHQFYFWCGLVFACFFASWALVRFYCPQAGGSGIPQVMSAIENLEKGDSGWLRSLLGIRMIFVKMLSSGIMMIAGGAIGREGPTIQIGSSLFLIVEDFFTKRNLIVRKDPVASRRAFILAGGAAGIAAAFNTPLGGIVFAIEELATNSFKQFRTTVITGVIVAGVTAQAFLGSYLYLGQPVISKIGIIAILQSILVGLFTGGAGAYFSKLLFWAVKQRRALAIRQELWLVGALAVIFIVLTRFSDGYSLGSGAEGIGSLLFESPEIHWYHAPVRFIATQVSYLVGGAGGIFAPALSIGANIGAWVGGVLPGFAENSHLLILIGMAAFLTGVTHAPFTSLVLVMEMTNRSSAIFALMVGTMAGHWIARTIDPRSFYDRIHDYFLPSISQK